MVRPLTTEWRHHYIKRLRKLGVEQIGDGFYGHVFQHPSLPEVAVKVFDVTDNQFLKFARWSMRHEWNPWVPKYYSIQMFDCINDHGYGIIFTERLEKLTISEFKLFIDEQFDCEPEHVTIECIREAIHSVESDDLRTLLNFLATRAKSIDFHIGNFMKRGEQIVFVDPVAGP